MSPTALARFLTAESSVHPAQPFTGAGSASGSGESCTGVALYLVGSVMAPWSADRFDGHGHYSRIFSWATRSSLDMHEEHRTALEQRRERPSKRKAAHDGTAVTFQRHR